MRQKLEHIKFEIIAFLNGWNYLSKKIYLRFLSLAFDCWEELHPETEQGEKVDFRKPWYLTYKREGRHFKMLLMKV